MGRNGNLAAINKRERKRQEGERQRERERKGPRYTEIEKEEMNRRKWQSVR
jgi:hypothetical protein